MESSMIIPLVDWSMGAIIIGIFAVVCVVMALVVFSMIYGNKKE